MKVKLKLVVKLREENTLTDWFNLTHCVLFFFSLLLNEQVSPTGNISTSVLKLTPRVGDHGKSLTCRAENTRLEGSALEDSWKLAVFCTWKKAWKIDFFLSSFFIAKHKNQNEYTHAERQRAQRTTQFVLYYVHTYKEYKNIKNMDFIYGGDTWLACRKHEKRYETSTCVPETHKMHNI